MTTTTNSINKINSKIKAIEEKSDDAIFVDDAVAFLQQMTPSFEAIKEFLESYDAVYQKLKEAEGLTAQQSLDAKAKLVELQEMVQKILLSHISDTSLLPQLEAIMEKLK